MTNNSNTSQPTRAADSRFDPFAITRPSPLLLRYYVLVSLLGGPVFPLVLLPLLFKYVTLRYRFDDKGVSMSWGVLFRKEVLLTYRRIQDIHLTRNIVQRWMGLATVGIQTASGSAGAEMSIEGILAAEPLRDFLYAQMRGARGLETEGTTAPSAEEPAAATGTGVPDDEALALLTEIRDSLATLAARREGEP